MSYRSSDKLRMSIHPKLVFTKMSYRSIVILELILTKTHRQLSLWVFLDQFKMGSAKIAPIYLYVNFGKKLKSKGETCVFSLNVCLKVGDHQK